jgi:hypothetical protein
MIRRIIMIKFVKPFKIIFAFLPCMILFILAFNIPMTRATQSRYHDLGDFKFEHRSQERLNTNSSDPTGEWPQDVYLSANVTFIDNMRFVGSWLDATGSEKYKTVHKEASFEDREPPFIITE